MEFNDFMPILRASAFYEGPSSRNAIEITLGHSKDGRMDLKQFALGLVTNQDGIPLFAKAHSGNASDKNTILESFLEIKSCLHLDDAIYYVIQLLGTEKRMQTVNR